MSDKPSQNDARPRYRSRVLFIGPPGPDLQGYSEFFRREGYDVSACHGATEAEEQLGDEIVDICFLDAELGKTSLRPVLAELHKASPWTTFVLLTPEESFRDVENCLDHGASDYLVKPCSPMQLHLSAVKHSRSRRMQTRLDCLSDELDFAPQPDLGMHSDSPAMNRVLELANQVADTDVNLLITGESGTGKGVLARAIHECSHRSDAQIAVINCPSLGPELLESELFGHRRGAFTGAVATNPGRVYQADGGTLFLDEIGDFPLALQPKLLRFVQDREFERIGDPKTRKSNVRIIAATNRDLETMVNEGEFREDLYYRLNVVSIHMPPLRERREDILVLASNFLKKFARSYRKPLRDFSPGASEAMLAYDWPGNIRELHNVIERAVILGNGASIQREELDLKRRENGSGSPRPGDPITLADLERAHINAIIQSQETLEKAAKVLGIDPSTLWRKRRQHGL